MKPPQSYAPPIAGKLLCHQGHGPMNAAFYVNDPMCKALLTWSIYRFRLTDQSMVSSHSELPSALHGAEIGLLRRSPSEPDQREFLCTNLHNQFCCIQSCAYTYFMNLHTEPTHFQFGCG